MSYNFKNVLFIGPEYVDHRGGMGSVLAIYASYIKPFKFISSYPEKSALKNFLHFMMMLIKYVKCLTFDKDVKIVHLHSAFRGSFYRKSVLGLIAKIFQKKVVLHFHSGSFRDFYRDSNFVLRAYIRFIVRNCDQIISISNPAFDFFSSLSSSNNVTGLDNPITINEKSPIETIEFPIRILFLSRINKNKGAYDLIEIINKHQEYFRNKIFLDVAGDGETSQFEQLIMRYGLNDIVRYNGWVSGTQKNNMIRDCNVLILPSYYEELPMTILEAMSYGKAIISTDVGGIPKVVKDNFNGRVFKPGDIKTLFTILRDTIECPDSLLAYGNNSYKLVQQYSVEAVMNKLGIIYDNLLKCEDNYLFANK